MRQCMYCRYFPAECNYRRNDDNRCDRFVAYDSNCEKREREWREDEIENGGFRPVKGLNPFGA